MGLDARSTTETEAEIQTFRPHCGVLVFEHIVVDSLAADLRGGGTDFRSVETTRLLKLASLEPMTGFRLHGSGRVL